GELNPALSGDCKPACSACLSACPFAPGNPDEDEIGRDLFAAHADMSHDPILGFYRGTYAGYSVSADLRENGASGGLATWIVETMLRTGSIDTVLCVGQHGGAGRLFSYSAVSDPGDVRRSSRSAYYPVELSEALRLIGTTPGRYAVSALPCVAKGIRLAASKRKSIRERLIAIIGLTCGQMKSAYFTGYMAARAGLTGPPRLVNFRGKDREGTADNFHFMFQGDNDTKKISWLDGPSEAWTNRWFSLNSCRFCDDIFAEVADVSLMDAWLPEYVTDPRGTNLVITRNPIIDELLRNGLLRGEIALQNIPPEQVIRSQGSVIEYKRQELPFRLYRSKRAIGGLKKRVGPRWKIGLSAMVRSVMRDIMQKKSRQVSSRYENADGFDGAAFRKKMLPYLWILKMANSAISAGHWPLRLLKKLF
ncbi:MAG TPA: Coenzyme F420 hydrogenase/dehydrogenase, beta subunit C-terminal domain, partial [Spirochaetota bacterium]|nr:Coenzyme F420 hydrogenase/dehydrogenase, beta subunit C-terminal domain [Spirochaetota bacterium]